MFPFCEIQTFTPAFLPAGAGPWKCAMVAGPVKPLKVMFQVTTCVLGS
jgi:hypothetical protein